MQRTSFTHSEETLFPDNLL